MIDPGRVGSRSSCPHDDEADLLSPATSTHQQSSRAWCAAQPKRLDPQDDEACSAPGQSSMRDRRRMGSRSSCFHDDEVDRLGAKSLDLA